MSSASAGSEASSRGYTDSERTDIRVPEDGSALNDPQLAKALVESILLPADRRTRRRQPLNERINSFYPALVGWALDMVELESAFRKIADLRKAYTDAISAADAERQRAVRRREEVEKEAASREKVLSDENSRLKTELGSKISELESVKSDFKSAQEKAEARRSHDEKKKNKLKKDRDCWAKEAELAKKETESAKNRAESAERSLKSATFNFESAKAEVRTLRQDLRRAKELGVEEFKASSELKDLFLQGSEATYWAGYDDCRTAIQDLYPDLDVSSIFVPEFGGDEDAITEGDRREEAGGPSEVPTEDIPIPDPSVTAGVDSPSGLIDEVLTGIRGGMQAEAVPPAEAAQLTDASETQPIDAQPTDTQPTTDPSSEAD